MFKLVILESTVRIVKEERKKAREVFSLQQLIIFRTSCSDARRLDEKNISDVLEIEDNERDLHEQSLHSLPNVAPNDMLGQHFTELAGVLQLEDEAPADRRPSRCASSASDKHSQMSELGRAWKRTKAYLLSSSQPHKRQRGGDVPNVETTGHRKGCVEGPQEGPEDAEKKRG